MSVRNPLGFGYPLSISIEKRNRVVPSVSANYLPSYKGPDDKLNISLRRFSFVCNSPPKRCRNRIFRTSGLANELGFNDKKNGKEDDSSDDDDDDSDGSLLMTDEERRDLRRKIREVLDINPEVIEEEDPEEKRKKMEKLLKDYPLVVNEEDPNWPEDDDGWGFNLSQFFNKISIKNVKKDDDESYDSEKEIVWQDDDYIQPIKDITSKEWEETVFKDISPLVILVHNRYKRPRQNEKMREELEKAVQIFWNSRLPSPRCVAVDAVMEDDLTSSLGVTVFPEMLFTKAGKIFYREKVVRPADELSKILAFFYYGAARPPCLDEKLGHVEEQIPSI